MPELSADIVLRPTRIGFLAQPTDLASVRAIMRTCTCLWGGIFNPIIPVFQREPKEWRSAKDRRCRGAEVAKGYARFFEPDVYVEARRGLLEEAGLAALRQEHALHSQVISLSEFLEPEQDRHWSEPAFGLNVHDALAHIYKTERQFVRRDERTSMYVSRQPGSGLTEAVFGVYPARSQVKYIEKAYLDVYRPDNVKPTPEVWRDVYLKGAVTPLNVTRYGLKAERHWYHDLVIFVFDPMRATDLIDLWNLRLEPRPVLPIPVEWFEVLGDDIHRVLRDEHRPVVGNPNGVMHHATIEFGRSIARPKAENLIRSLKPGLPEGALAVKYWRNPIWVEHRNDRVQRDNRLRVMAKDRTAALVFQDDQLRTKFETLEPEFAERYGGRHHRWVNVLNISNYSNRSIATVLPFNTFDRSWPHLTGGGDAVPVGSEGWVFPQQFSRMGQHVSFLDTNDAIAGSLGQLGIKAELSEPGHIARQMLEHLGGFWGVGLLADIDTIKLLNTMAGGLRRKSNDKDTVEETFDLRTAPLKDWIDLIAARGTRRALRRRSLEDFTKRNVIRLGLESDCPHCNAKNWSSLTGVDYRVICERCLKPYDFPQAALRKHNRNFTYRVVGPFTAPDFARGSYGALLTLRLLGRINSSFENMTFSTAMSLSFDGLQREVDFVAWRGDDKLGREHRRPPQLVIGEAKSLGSGELITARDLAKLKSVATKLPDAVVVISVLRDHFTRNEKQLLRKLVKWGRRANAHGEPTNPVLLLTAHELMFDHHLSATWKDLGGSHARFSDYHHTRTLTDLADATQQIYLGLPAFHQSRSEYRAKRAARRSASGRSSSNPAQ
jgi:hypothetical protein